MTHGVTRREVFQSTLAAAGLAASGHLVPSRVEGAQPAAGSTERIAVDPEILPLVQLLEKTAPDRAHPGRGGATGAGCRTGGSWPQSSCRRSAAAPPTTSGSSTRSTRRAWT